MSHRRTSAEIFLDVRCQHGEGPVWMENEGCLYFIDIPGQKLHWFDGDLKSYDFDRQITCVLPTDNGRFIASSFDELHFWAPESGLSAGLLGESRPFNPGIVRHNDGVIAPDGSLIMGCLHMEETDPISAVYRFNARHEVQTLMSDQVVANGIDFSPDRKRMYVADTGTGNVWRCECADGGISSRAVIARYDPKLGGRPDGLCVDVDGNVWVAILGGGRIEALSPDGELLESVSVDAKNVTSCCFGGKNLDTLYITTGQVENDKLGGAVFAHRPGVKGQPFGRFREKSN